MANTTRQNSLLVNQDWTRVYESFRNADFQSYDFQTLRKSMVDYLQIYYPEDFNDFVESSEYIALIDLIAFLGQSLAFRTDLNARENFIDTAERRDSVLKLARLISYVPKRNQTATGFLKFDSIQTTESLTDSNGLDLTNLIVKWNDSTNNNWYEQFAAIINAALPNNQLVGRPANSKIIGGITNDEYNLNISPGTLPIYKFSTQVENSALAFEVVSGTSADKEYIYEAAPYPGRPLNILYKNDNLGNASNNTGFFFYFKQGDLQNLDFSFAENIPNNIAAVNYDNINNTDVWLYELSNLNSILTQWEQTPAVSGVNIIYNSNAAKKSFQVTTRNNDQINLVFGDGTFASIPQGRFRTYFRTSAGLDYKITPDEMQNISMSIPYVSRLGRLETLTVVASLKYTVVNAISRESISEIKSKAPQQYYTQNRMITGEDYNTFPYSKFNSISKVKSVNRTSSGVSRYLDVIDSTGTYSSTNIFGEDGILYKNNINPNIDFTWTTTADINRIIQNQIVPQVQSKSLQHFYYKNFTRFTLSNLFWNRTTVGSNSSTGYFVNGAGVAQQIGSGVVGNTSFITNSSMVIFSPGSGNYFNSLNEIVALPSSGVLPSNGQMLLYVTVTNLIGNGNQGVLSTGYGPVSLSENVPANAQAITVIPAFSNSFSAAFVTKLIQLISSYSEFGVRYNQSSREWIIVLEQDLDSSSAFSQTNQGSATGANLDASWLMHFTVSGLSYTVVTRGLDYIFESSKETKFYFDKKVKVFDKTTGLTINDNINVLKVNGDPDTSYPLTKNIIWNIYNQKEEADGYINTNSVNVTFSDINDDGVPDNPDIFDTIVAPSVNPTAKYVFVQSVLGYNNFETYVPISNELVNTSYDLKTSILPYINNYVIGQIFYATQANLFYVLTLTGATRSLVLNTTYTAYVGRQNLYFQYRHNAPGDRRIDPTPSNLIDMFILTKEFETSYRTWALDTTNTVVEPDIPSSETLRLAYNELENFKSVSDAIIYNSAKFKPLFGSKASSELQATFKVIKNSNINLSDSEIRSQVLAYINAFFDTGNWDFGETFYFTELATYIQQGLVPNISSIVIVPNSETQSFGSLQQISSEPNEILISCATVQNIEVISAITAAQLNLQNQSVNTVIN